MPGNECLTVEEFRPTFNHRIVLIPPLEFFHAKASQFDLSLDFEPFRAIQESCMSSWSNFKRLITPGKVQRSSKFSPFLDVSELCHLGVS